MALKKCKECGGDVSTSAKACPKCGAKPPGAGIGCGGLIVILLGVVFFVGVYEAQKRPSSPTPRTEARPAQPAAPAEPIIILESMTCDRTDGGTYARIRGRARNNSSSPLQSVFVIGSFLGENDEDLGSDRGLLDISPLLPGQSSSFEVFGPRNQPAYRRCRVDAFTVGGRQVMWRRET